MDLKKDLCGCNIIHEDLVDLAKKNQIDSSDAEGAAQLFKMIADPTRLKILQLLSITELCVCDISHLLNMTQSAISHQLRTLKQAHLVKNRREGKVVYYALDDDHVQNIISEGIRHYQHR